MSDNLPTSVLSSVPQEPYNNQGRQPEKSNLSKESRTMNNESRSMTASDPLITCTIPDVTSQALSPQLQHSQSSNTEQELSSSPPMIDQRSGCHSMQHSSHQLAGLTPSSQESLTTKRSTNETIDHPLITHAAPNLQRPELHLAAFGSPSQPEHLPPVSPDSPTPSQQLRPQLVANDNLIKAHFQRGHGVDEERHELATHHSPLNENTYDLYDTPTCEDDNTKDDDGLDALSYESEDLAGIESPFLDEELSESCVADVPTTSLSTITEISETPQSEVVSIPNAISAASNRLGQSILSEEPTLSQDANPIHLSAEADTRVSNLHSSEASSAPPTESPSIQDFAQENIPPAPSEHGVPLVVVESSHDILEERHHTNSFFYSADRVIQVEAPLNHSVNDPPPAVIERPDPSLLESFTVSPSDATSHAFDQLNSDPQHDSASNSNSVDHHSDLQLKNRPIEVQVSETGSNEKQSQEDHHTTSELLESSVSNQALARPLAAKVENLSLSAHTNVDAKGSAITGVNHTRPPSDVGKILGTFALIGQEVDASTQANDIRHSGAGPEVTLDPPLAFKFESNEHERSGQLGPPSTFDRCGEDDRFSDENTSIPAEGSACTHQSTPSLDKIAAASDNKSVNRGSMVNHQQAIHPTKSQSTPEENSHISRAPDPIQTRLNSGASDSMGAAQWPPTQSLESLHAESAQDVKRKLFNHHYSSSNTVNELQSASRSCRGPTEEVPDGSEIVGEPSDFARRPSSPSVSASGACRPHELPTVLFIPESPGFPTDQPTSTDSTTPQCHDHGSEGNWDLEVRSLQQKQSTSGSSVNFNPFYKDALNTSAYPRSDEGNEYGTIIHDAHISRDLPAASEDDSDTNLPDLGPKDSLAHGPDTMQVSENSMDQSQHPVHTGLSLESSDESDDRSADLPPEDTCDTRVPPDDPEGVAGDDPTTSYITRAVENHDEPSERFSHVAPSQMPIPHSPQTFDCSDESVESEQLSNQPNDPKGQSNLSQTVPPAPVLLIQIPRDDNVPETAPESPHTPALTEPTTSLSHERNTGSPDHLQELKFEEEPSAETSAMKEIHFAYTPEESPIVASVHDRSEEKPDEVKHDNTFNESSEPHTNHVGPLSPPIDRAASLVDGVVNFEDNEEQTQSASHQLPNTLANETPAKSPVDPPIDGGASAIKGESAEITPHASEVSTSAGDIAPSNARIIEPSTAAHESIGQIAISVITQLDTLPAIEKAPATSSLPMENVDPSIKNINFENTTPQSEVNLGQSSTSKVHSLIARFEGQAQLESLESSAGVKESFQIAPFHAVRSIQIEQHSPSFEKVSRQLENDISNDTNERPIVSEETIDAASAEVQDTRDLVSNTSTSEVPISAQPPKALDVANNDEENSATGKEELGLDQPIVTSNDTPAQRSAAVQSKTSDHECGSSAYANMATHESNAASASPDINPLVEQSSPLTLSQMPVEPCVEAIDGSEVTTEAQVSDNHSTHANSHRSVLSTKAPVPASLSHNLDLKLFESAPELPDTSPLAEPLLSIPSDRNNGSSDQTGELPHGDQTCPEESATKQSLLAGLPAEPSTLASAPDQSQAGPAETVSESSIDEPRMDAPYADNSSLTPTDRVDVTNDQVSPFGKDEKQSEGASNQLSETSANVTSEVQQVNVGEIQIKEENTENTSERLDCSIPRKNSAATGISESSTRAPEATDERASGAPDTTRQHVPFEAETASPICSTLKDGTDPLSQAPNDENKAAPEYAIDQSTIPSADSFVPHLEVQAQPDPPDFFGVVEETPEIASVHADESLMERPAPLEKSTNASEKDMSNEDTEEHINEDPAQPQEPVDGASAQGRDKLDLACSTNTNEALIQTPPVQTFEFSKNNKECFPPIDQEDSNTGQLIDTSDNHLATRNAVKEFQVFDQNSDTSVDAEATYKIRGVTVSPGDNTVDAQSSYVAATQVPVESSSDVIDGSDTAAEATSLADQPTDSTVRPTSSETEAPQAPLAQALMVAGCLMNESPHLEETEEQARTAFNQPPATLADEPSVSHQVDAAIDAGAIGTKEQKLETTPELPESSESTEKLTTLITNTSELFTRTPGVADTLHVLAEADNHLETCVMSREDSDLSPQGPSIESETVREQLTLDQTSVLSTDQLVDRTEGQAQLDSLNSVGLAQETFQSVSAHANESPRIEELTPPFEKSTHGSEEGTPKEGTSENPSQPPETVNAASVDVQDTSDLAPCSGADEFPLPVHPDQPVGLLEVEQPERIKGSVLVPSTHLSNKHDISPKPVSEDHTSDATLMAKAQSEALVKSSNQDDIFDNHNKSTDTEQSVPSPQLSISGSDGASKVEGPTLEALPNPETAPSVSADESSAQNDNSEVPRNEADVPHEDALQNATVEQGHLSTEDSDVVDPAAPFISHPDSNGSAAAKKVEGEGEAPPNAAVIEINSQDPDPPCEPTSIDRAVTTSNPQPFELPDQPHVNETPKFGASEDQSIPSKDESSVASSDIPVEIPLVDVSAIPAQAEQTATLAQSTMIPPARNDDNQGIIDEHAVQVNDPRHDDGAEEIAALIGPPEPSRMDEPADPLINLDESPITNAIETSPEILEETTSRDPVVKDFQTIPQDPEILAVKEQLPVICLDGNNGSSDQSGTVNSTNVIKDIQNTLNETAMVRQSGPTCDTEDEPSDQLPIVQDNASESQLVSQDASTSSDHANNPASCENETPVVPPHDTTFSGDESIPARDHAEDPIAPSTTEPASQPEHSTEVGVASATVVSSSTSDKLTSSVESFASTSLVNEPPSHLPDTPLESQTSMQAMPPSPIEPAEPYVKEHSATPASVECEPAITEDASTLSIDRAGSSTQNHTVGSPTIQELPEATDFLVDNRVDFSPPPHAPPSEASTLRSNHDATYAVSVTPAPADDAQEASDLPSNDISSTEQTSPLDQPPQSVKHFAPIELPQAQEKSLPFAENETLPKLEHSPIPDPSDWDADRDSDTPHAIQDSPKATNLPGNETPTPAQPPPSDEEDSIVLPATKPMQGTPDSPSAEVTSLEMQTSPAIVEQFQESINALANEGSFSTGDPLPVSDHQPATTAQESSAGHTTSIYHSSFPEFLDSPTPSVVSVPRPPVDPAAIVKLSPARPAVSNIQREIILPAKMKKISILSGRSSGSLLLDDLDTVFTFLPVDRLAPSSGNSEASPNGAFEPSTPAISQKLDAPHQPISSTSCARAKSLSGARTKSLNARNKLTKPYPSFRRTGDPQATEQSHKRSSYRSVIVRGSKHTSPATQTSQSVRARSLKLGDFGLRTKDSKPRASQLESGNDLADAFAFIEMSETMKYSSKADRYVNPTLSRRLSKSVKDILLKRHNRGLRNKNSPLDDVHIPADFHLDMDRELADLTDTRGDIPQDVRGQKAGAAQRQTADNSANAAGPSAVAQKHQRDLDVLPTVRISVDSNRNTQRSHRSHHHKCRKPLGYDKKP